MANIRDNLLYRLRRKGVRVQTKERIIYFLFDGDSLRIIQVQRLCKEFHFNIQLEIQ